MKPHIMQNPNKLFHFLRQRLEHGLQLADRPRKIPLIFAVSHIGEMDGVHQHLPGHGIVEVTELQAPLPITPISSTCSIYLLTREALQQPVHEDLRLLLLRRRGDRRHAHLLRYVF